MTRDTPGGVGVELLDGLTLIASRAAAAIVAVADLKKRDKADRSPVTAADEASESIILDELSRFMPDCPVISEEAAAKGTLPKAGDRFFLVDPLDGTRELLAGQQDFTVNIALIQEGKPVAAVIAAPAMQLVWRGMIGGGAERFRLSPGASPADATERATIRTRPRPAKGAIAVISRFHRDAETDAYLDRFPGIQRLVVGASIKFCRLAEGAADIYARMSSMYEWDIAAGHALIAAAGGTMTALDGGPIRYGQPGFRSPKFVALGDGAN